jgi:hypothetical protein
MGSGQPWQSSYTVWATKDRHARAHSVLWDRRSLQIVQALDGQDHKRPAQPWNDNRCLACHSLPIDVAAANEASRAVLADGVSCEACHGAAERWLVAHTTVDWGSLKQTGEARRLGMRDVEHLAGRAEACVRCHVGDANEASGGTRQVTHDLIAAGHPRLAFEFATYTANMPAHWDVATEGQANEGVRAWAIGQVISAQAALELQASHAAAGSDLVDYDCYACHHDLARESWRTRQPTRGRQGELRPNTWYTSMLEPLSKLAGVEIQLPDSRTELNKHLQAVDGWARKQDSAGLRRAMVEIAQRATHAEQWDDATQCYLALVALDDAHRDLGKSPSRSDQAIRQSLKSLYVELKFQNTPDTAASPPELDSPRNYDPERFLAELQRLTKLLSSP